MTRESADVNSIINEKVTCCPNCIENTEQRKCLNALIQDMQKMTLKETIDPFLDVSYVRAIGRMV